MYIGNTLDILPKRKDIRIVDIILIRSDICSNADIPELNEIACYIVRCENGTSY